jgi:hypothetical protein
VQPAIFTSARTVKRDPAPFRAWELVQTVRRLEKQIGAARDAIPDQQGYKRRRAELSRAIMCCRRLTRALGSLIPLQP